MQWRGSTGQVRMVGGVVSSLWNKCCAFYVLSLACSHPCIILTRVVL